MADPTPIWGITSEQWNVLNVLGTWASAVGSVAAAVVALYLANRAGAQRLKTSAKAVMIVTQSSQLLRSKHDIQHYVQLEVVNRGDRAIHITNLGWRSGLFKKQYCVQKIPQIQGNRLLPVTLEHGESARWFLTVSEGEDSYYNYFAKVFLKDAGPLKFMTLRATFHTSIGNVFTTRPDSQVVKGLKAAYAALLASE